jgi:SSS family transporter
MIAQLTPAILLGVIILYFVGLIAIARYTGRNASNEQFFLAGRQAPWFVVAFGMVGASLSGVTFISIPGKVGSEGLNQSFSYLQVVFGYLLGYVFIALILLPLYYRLNLTTIYTYLGQRLGFYSQKTGSAFFMLSRLIGASFRLFLAAIVLQKFVLEPFGFPFWLTVVVALGLIWVYTFRGGINTVIWTDTLQTTFMILAVLIAIFSIASTLETGLGDLLTRVRHSEYSKVFFFADGWADANNFFKQFLSGALITIVMTGLDQDMMQKNLSCRNIGDAQKNMFTFSAILLVVNLIFLTLGALLYIYASEVGIDIPRNSDLLFPTIALEHLSPFIGIVFILGLTAAAYSSADSSLTSLTTAFCVDFLGFDNSERSEEEKKRVRMRVHVLFTIVVFLIILGFSVVSNDAVINQLFIAAGYTYGPLLGLFAFGLLTKLRLRDHLVIPICIAAPIASFLLDKYSQQLLNGFSFGFLILALNGLLTFLGLLGIAHYRDFYQQGGAASEQED